MKAIESMPAATISQIVPFGPLAWDARNVQNDQTMAELERM